jgi:hypothetical protein
VHGSLGTGDAIAYSDFDALAILKDDVLAAPSRLAPAAWKLSRARSIMLDTDPLQHHGWFLLSEAQLAAYPDHAFPVALFAYAKSLLPGQGRRLALRIHDAPEAGRAAFDELSSRLLDRLAGGRPPSDAYALKLLLSEFMLLPALYVQVRDGRGVYKKLSFDLARPDFTPEEWAVMDEASALRASWSVELAPLRRMLLTRAHPIREVAVRWFAPAIPAPMGRRLTVAFYGRMQALAARMRRRLQVG